jgi:hypothetical protein
MPALGLLILLAQIACAVHVVRTGRNYLWIFLIIFVPLIGIAVYLAAEVLPQLAGSRGARQAASGVGRMLDPGRGLREAQRQHEISPTVQTKAALADAYLRAGQPEPAAGLYRETLVGIHATDPGLMLGLARALFGQGDIVSARNTLESLRRANPDYVSPEAQLLYARSLEEVGDVTGAVREYAAVAGSYPGQEARCRYAMLLEKLGRKDEARRLYEEIRQAIDYGPRQVYREQRQWYDIARRHLAAQG